MDVRFWEKRYAVVSFDKRLECELGCVRGTQPVAHDSSSYCTSQLKRYLVVPGADMVQHIEVINGIYHLHKVIEGSAFCLCNRKNRAAAAEPDTIPYLDPPVLTGYALIPHTAYSSVTEANFSVMF